MTQRVHGSARAHQNLSGELKYFNVFASAPDAVSDPENATGINILVTGSIRDESQKNFEVLVQSVGLRAMPVQMSNPAPTADLALVGAPTLTGEGFIWKFAVEREDVFTKFTPGNEDPIGLLVDELNGIVLPNGTVLNTAPGGNIEFRQMDIL